MTQEMIAEQLKEEGIAAASKRPIFAVAQELAFQIAADRDGITADDVHVALVAAGYDPSELGNAAGALFRGKEWDFTGSWRKSPRITNHRRENRVWRLAHRSA